MRYLTSTSYSLGTIINIVANKYQKIEVIDKSVWLMQCDNICRSKTMEFSHVSFFLFFQLFTILLFIYVKISQISKLSKAFLLRVTFLAFLYIWLFDAVFNTVLEARNSQKKMSNKKQRIPEKLENLILNYLAQSDVRRNNCHIIYYWFVIIFLIVYNSFSRITL